MVSHMMIGNIPLTLGKAGIKFKRKANSWNRKVGECMRGAKGNRQSIRAKFRSCVKA